MFEALPYPDSTRSNTLGSPALGEIVIFPMTGAGSWTSGSSSLSSTLISTLEVTSTYPSREAV